MPDLSKVAKELIALKATKKFKWAFDVMSMFDIIEGVNCFECNGKIGFWCSCYITEKKSDDGESMVCCLDCWNQAFGHVTDKLSEHPYTRPSSNPAAFTGAKFLDAFYFYLEVALEVPTSEAAAAAVDDDDPIWDLLEVALSYEEILHEFRRKQVAFESYGKRGTFGRGSRNVQASNDWAAKRKVNHTSIGECGSEGCKQKFCYDNLCTHLDHVHPLVHCAKTGHVYNAAV